MRKTTLLITILMLVGLVLSGCIGEGEKTETEKISIPIIGEKIEEYEESMEKCCKECFDLRTNIYPDMHNLWGYDCSEFKGISKECQTFFAQHFTLGTSYGECKVKSLDLEKYALSSFLNGLKEKYGNKKWTGTINGKCLEPGDKMVTYSQSHAYTMTINEMKIDFDSLALREDTLSSNPTIPLLGSATVSITPETYRGFCSEVPELGETFFEDIPINNPIPFKFVGRIYQGGAAEGMGFSFHPVEGKLILKRRQTASMPPPGYTHEDISSGPLNNVDRFCPMTMAFEIEGDGLLEKMIIEYKSGNEEAEGELYLSQ